MSINVTFHAHKLALVHSTSHRIDNMDFGLVTEKRIPIKLFTVEASIIPPVEVGTALSKMELGSCRLLTPFRKNSSRDLCLVLFVILPAIFPSHFSGIPDDPSTNGRHCASHACHFFIFVFSHFHSFVMAIVFVFINSSLPFIVSRFVRCLYSVGVSVDVCIATCLSAVTAS